MDTYYSFSTGTVRMDPSIGVSHLYDCTISLTDCDQISQGSAEKSTLTMPSSSIGSGRASATLNVDSAVPLVAGAPAINANLTFTLSAGHSTIIGYHERMPVHEIYGGLDNSEFGETPVYQSDSHYMYCLFGSLPDCTVDLNLSF